MSIHCVQCDAAMIRDQVAKNWLGLVADVNRKNSRPAVLVRASFQLVKENTNVRLAERKHRGKSRRRLGIELRSCRGRIVDHSVVDQGGRAGELGWLVRLGLWLRLRLLLLLQLLQHRLHRCSNGGCNGISIHLSGFFFGSSLSSSSRDGENLFVSTFEVNAQTGGRLFRSWERKRFCGVSAESVSIVVDN